MSLFTKAEARAIKVALDRRDESVYRPCILTSGRGVMPSLDLKRAELKIISAAAAKLGDEWLDDAGRQKDGA